jgi:hypothetical protein
MNHLQEQSHTISPSLKQIRPLFVPNPVGGVGTRRAPEVPLALTKRKQAARIITILDHHIRDIWRI